MSCDFIDPSIGRTIIEAAGGPRLGAALLTAARSVGGVEELFAYRVGPGGIREGLLSNSDLIDSEQRAGEYLRRFHRFDPARAAMTEMGEGSGASCVVPASGIARADYRAFCFERPHFSEKLCYGWRGTEESFVLSFYRRQGDDAPSQARLAVLANLALSALGHQSDLRRTGRAPLVERLERRLAQALPDLTLRERQVCARTLAGWTAEAIGEALNIRRPTVMTYRQRAYQRIGAGNAGALLDLVLD